MCKHSVPVAAVHEFRVCQVRPLISEESDIEACLILCRNVGKFLLIKFTSKLIIISSQSPNDSEEMGASTSYFCHF